MVISHMFGGLGNQLFQYAAGRSLSMRHNVPMMVDLSEFEHYKLRNFDLGYFNTKYEVATGEQVAALRPSSFFSKAAQYLRPKSQRTYHRERSYRYDRSFENIGPSVYLKGYFQCLPYFEPVAATIREEFTIRDEYISHLGATATLLNQPGSIGIHIRRGDYKNADVQAILAEAGKDYYKKAISIMLQRVKNPVFYVFSDDIEWVKENLEIPDAQYISGRITRSAIEDFYLLSCCANQIIPNSTFAWWAAWLNTNEEKTVIMPAKWFNDESQNRDRTPAGWLTA